MLIAGYQKLSLVDYDGITACTVFTAGCNLRCPYCHNAPLVLGDNAPNIQEEVIAYLIKRAKLLDGVCVTGGEPTLQHDLCDFLLRVKNMGYKVKLDTNGTSSRVLAKVLQENLADYVAMDVKTSLTNYHLMGATKDNIANIEQSVALLKKSGVRYEFRTTLAQEFVKDDDVKTMAQWLAGARKCVLQKYTDNENCFQRGFNAVSKNRAEQYAAYLARYVESVALRGY